MEATAHPLARLIVIRSIRLPKATKTYILHVDDWVDKEFAVVKVDKSKFCLINGTIENRVRFTVTVDLQATIAFTNGNTYTLDAVVEKRHFATSVAGLEIVYEPGRPSVRYMQSFMEHRILTSITNGSADVYTVNEHVFVTMGGEILCCFPVQDMKIEMVDGSPVCVAADENTLNTSELFTAILERKNFIGGYRCKNTLRHHLMPDGALFSAKMKTACPYYYVGGNLFFTDLDGEVSMDDPADQLLPCQVPMDIHQIRCIHVLIRDFIVIVVNGRTTPIIYQLPAGVELVVNPDEPHILLMNDKECILTFDGNIREICDSYPIALAPVNTVDHPMVEVIPCGIKKIENGRTLYRRLIDKEGAPDNFRFDGVNFTISKDTRVIRVDTANFLYIDGSIRC